MISATDPIPVRSLIWSINPVGGRPLFLLPCIIISSGPCRLIIRPRDLRIWRCIEGRRRARSLVCLIIILLRRILFHNHVFSTILSYKRFRFLFFNFSKRVLRVTKECGEMNNAREESSGENERDLSGVVSCYEKRAHSGSGKNGYGNVEGRRGGPKEKWLMVIRTAGRVRVRCGRSRQVDV